MNAKEMLDRLAELYAQRDLAELDKKHLIDQVLTPEIKAQIEDIEIEFGARTEAINTTADELEKQIKDYVKRLGETAKGDHVMAVFNRGRISWDNRKLEGMMSLIPQLAEARKEGEPSVSIRRMG